MLVVYLNCWYFIFKTFNPIENIEFTFYLFFIEKLNKKLVDFRNTR